MPTQSSSSSNPQQEPDISILSATAQPCQEHWGRVLRRVLVEPLFSGLSTIASQLKCRIGQRLSEGFCEKVLTDRARFLGWLRSSN